jgi:hypothetical protein
MHIIQFLLQCCHPRRFEIGSMAVEAAIKVLKGEKIEKKVSLRGSLLSRERRDQVRQFKERLKELST